MNLFQTVILTVLIGNTALGLFVLLSNSKRAVNIAFFSLTFLMMLWLGSMLHAALQQSNNMLLYLVRQTSALAGTIPLGIFILHLAILEPTITAGKILYKLRYWLVACLSMIAICHSPIFVISATPATESQMVPASEYGIGFIPYLVFFTAVIVAMIMAFRRAAKSSTGVQKAESQFLQLGCMLSFTAGISLFGASVLFHIQEVSRFVPLSVLILDGFVAYGIATRRILSVSAVLQRVVSYALMAVYLTGLYIMSVWVGRSLLQWLVADPTYVSHLLAALVLAFSVAPAHGWMQAVSHRLFAGAESVNMDDVLARASHIFQEVTTEAKLMANFSRLIERTFETAGAVLLTPEGSAAYREAYPAPRADNTLLIQSSSDAVQLLMREREPLTVDVLDRMWPSAQVVCAREELAALGAAAILGGFLRKDLKAVLILAPKSSGAIYDARDQHILQLLCDQFAVALENARLYTEVQNGKIYNDILLDSLASCMVAVHADRTVMVFNKQAQKLTGMDETVALNKPIDGLPNPLPEVLDTLLTGKGSFRDRDITLRLDADTEVPIRASGSVFHGHTGDLLGALLVFNDMTVLKKMEEQIRRTDRLSSLGTLSAGMAHEIKNPLVTIKTFTQLLPQQHNDPDFQNTFFDLVGQEVQRIDTIVNRLLNFARPARASLRRIALHEVIENSLRLTEQQMVQQNISLDRKLDAPRSIIRGDAEQLNQTFVNFFLNAIQAMGEDGTLTVQTSIIESKKSIPLVREAQAACIQVEIQDTGCGISQEEVGRIFDPFFTTKSTGVGLGLSVSHGIIQEHEGTVDVESEQGKGTVFHLQFPLVGEEGGEEA